MYRTAASNMQTAGTIGAGTIGAGTTLLKGFGDMYGRS